MPSEALITTPLRHSCRVNSDKAPLWPLFATKEDWQTQLKTHKVRLQWDPDHSPKGAKLERKAMQLGLKDEILQQFNSEWIVKITDVTEFVKQQHRNALNSIEKLEVPVENILHLDDTELQNQLGVTKNL